MFSHKSEGNIKPGTLIFNQLTPVPEIRLHYRHNLPLIDGETSPLDPLFLNWGGGVLPNWGVQGPKIKGGVGQPYKKMIYLTMMEKNIGFDFSNLQKSYKMGPFWAFLTIFGPKKNSRRLAAILN